MIFSNDIIVTPGEFFFRNVAGQEGKLLLLARVDGRFKPHPNKYNDHAVIAIGTMRLDVQLAAEASQETRGLRADQVLCNSYDLQKMKRVELGKILAPVASADDALRQWMAGL